MKRLTIAVVALIALTAGAQSALGAYPGANGRIGFHRADGHIYSVRADGSGLRDLGRGATPSYSPDGARIAFALDGDIWRMRADGSNRRRITSAQSSEADPTWSPDGSRIAFASDRSGGGIFTRSDFGEPVRLVQTPVSPDDLFSAFDHDPAWGTDDRIYVSREFDVNGTLCEDPYGTFVADPFFGTVAQWRPFALEADPAPDGQSVVYADVPADGFCGQEFGIAIADSDGSRPRAVTLLRSGELGPPFDHQPVFSPNGRKVAFQRGRFVMIVNTDGSNLRRLVVGSAPSWQPR